MYLKTDKHYSYPNVPRWHYGKIIKLCCYMIRSTRSPEGSPRPPGWLQQFYFYPVMSKIQNSINIYRVDLTSLNESNSRFQKPVMFWRWRHHGVALWRHGRGAWHNCLLLATASNVNCWADVANHMTWLWQAGDTENFERWITGLLWAVSWPRAAQSRDNILFCNISK